MVHNIRKGRALKCKDERYKRKLQTGVTDGRFRRTEISTFRQTVLTDVLDSHYKRTIQTGDSERHQRQTLQTCVTDGLGTQILKMDIKGRTTFQKDITDGRFRRCKRPTLQMDVSDDVTDSCYRRMLQMDVSDGWQRLTLQMDVSDSRDRRSFQIDAKDECYRWTLQTVGASDGHYPLSQQTVLTSRPSRQYSPRIRRSNYKVINEYL